MTAAVQSILDQLPKLTRRERSLIADAAMDSLEVGDDAMTPEQWEASWMEEIGRRHAKYISGESKTMTEEEFFQRVEARLP